MLRDVLVVSMERGRFLGAMAGLIVIVLVLKLPAELIGVLIVRLLDALERRCIWGYLAAAVLAVSWFACWRKHRSSPATERPD
jgi:hypothetical protein